MSLLVLRNGIETVASADTIAEAYAALHAAVDTAERALRERYPGHGVRVSYNVDSGYLDVMSERDRNVVLLREYFRIEEV